MEDWQGAEPRGLKVQSWSADDHLELNFGISFPHSNILLCWNNGGTIVDMKSNQLLKLDEWTRIEISHVEEGGQHFLSFTVGGQSKRSHVHQDKGNLKNMTGVMIYIGSEFQQHQPGFVKGLLVLDQQ